MTSPQPIANKKSWPTIEGYHLESICKIIEKGLSGTEIRRLLAECDIIDTDSSITKWKRLFNAFAAVQNRDAEQQPYSQIHLPRDAAFAVPVVESGNRW